MPSSVSAEDSGLGSNHAKTGLEKTDDEDLGTNASIQQTNQDISTIPAVGESEELGSNSDLEKTDDEDLGTNASIQQPNQDIPREGDDLFRFYQPLYKAALVGDWESAKSFLTKNPDANIAEKVNGIGMTILHVALNKGHTVFIKKLVQSGLFPKEEMRLQVQDHEGWTALHYAATSGNLTAVKVLVSEDSNLTQLVDKTYSLTPILHAAVWAANKKVIWYLAQKTTNGPPANCSNVSTGPFTGVDGARLINGLALLAYYDICLFLLNRYPDIANYLVNDFDLLITLVRSSEHFPSGSRLTFWERCIYHFIPAEVGSNFEAPQLQLSSTIISKLSTVKKWIFGATSKAIVYVPSFKHIRDVKYKHKCIMELLEITCKTMSDWDTNTIETSSQTSTVLGVASENGVIEIIRALLKHVPHYMDNINIENGILLYAIRNRRENVFNLMMEQGVTAKLIHKYEDDEPIWYATAKLAPYTRLISVSSPALQMQRELQWFQSMKKFVPLDLKRYRNRHGQTAQELFTIEHKDLAQGAEKWLKETSNSCMVVATLIITVVFAAAFTIPGGNIEGTGTPLFLNKSDFMVFIVSDAVGMFSSATSILMFLSILTARYAEEDFLYALPKRLILGLVSLLIAIASMMVAFGATLYIVLYPKFKWIIFPIIGLTSIPVVLFILLQLPLVIYMVRSTYGPSILKPMKTSQ